MTTSNASSVSAKALLKLINDKDQTSAVWERALLDNIDKVVNVAGRTSLIVKTQGETVKGAHQTCLLLFLYAQSDLSRIKRSIQDLREDSNFTGVMNLIELDDAPSWEAPQSTKVVHDRV